MSATIVPDRSPKWLFTTFYLSVTVVAVVAAITGFFASPISPTLHDTQIASIASICLALCAFYKTAMDTSPVIDSPITHDPALEQMTQRLKEQKKRIQTLELDIIERTSLEEEQQVSVQFQISDIAKREAALADREFRALRYEDSLDSKLLLLNNSERRTAETEEEHRVEVAMLQAQLTQAGAINATATARADELFRHNLWYQAENQSMLGNLAMLSFENENLKASKVSQAAEIQKLQTEIAQLRHKNGRNEKIIREGHALWSTEVRPLELRILAAERAKRESETAEKNIREALTSQRLLTKEMTTSLEGQLSNLKTKYKSTRIDQLEKALDTEKAEVLKVQDNLQEANQTVVSLKEEIATLHESLAASGQDAMAKEQEISVCMELIRDLNAEIDDLKQWENVSSMETAIDTPDEE